MVGTKAGGLKASATCKAKYGEDFYKINGAKGGRNGHTGGFASSHELAVEAGRKGGMKSRRGKPTSYEDLKKIINLHLSGETIADIARTTGKDYNTIKRIVRRVWSTYE